MEKRSRDGEKEGAGNAPIAGFVCSGKERGDREEKRAGKAPVVIVLGRFPTTEKSCAMVEEQFMWVHVGSRGLPVGTKAPVAHGKK